MAIGATPNRVMALDVIRYVRLALVGMACGAMVSVVALRLVAAYLVGVTTRDPTTFIVLGALVLAMVAVAAWISSRRIQGASLATELARN